LAAADDLRYVGYERAARTSLLRRQQRLQRFDDAGEVAVFLRQEKHATLDDDAIERPLVEHGSCKRLDTPTSRGG
jgi:hypothetical protein